MERDAVHLWRVVLASPFDESILSPDEMQRANRFQISALRDRYSAGRCALRVILAQYLNIPPQAIAFHYNEHGKPSLARDEFVFNLSNAHDRMLLGVTQCRQLGVDLEKRGRRMDAANIAHRFFSAPEVAQLEALPEAERDTAFLRGWIRKEAYLKAMGTGIGGGLGNFAVSVEDLAETALLWKAESMEGAADWMFYDVDMGQEFIASVALTRNPCRLQMIDYYSPLTFQPAR